MTKFPSWDEMTEKEQLESEYSDRFKEVNGFRPRGFDLSVEELNISINALIDDAIKDSQKAIFDIENSITTVQENCTCDRKTALRFIKDAEGDSWTEWKHFCYRNNLPGNYFEGMVEHE